MSAVTPELVDQMKKTIVDTLGSSASKAFLLRVEAVVADWAAGKLTAAQACEKVEKMVTLFIDADKAQQIASRCAPIVMKETSQKK